ncbi:C4-dicarboxylate TRAP transporter substrate-binding protein [Sneathiella sp. HT1-7]|uniref:C4-dicarboxylate TRAP transporter substrate-binding protein n=1 Tax=Sneathiella sp. HT1-7 TaxID=2887192 RepID=UPI001D158C04|nr:C4-dicarboxylate TRAP transporter substrate-binding protein [Sneathiella sp. HT1-7]MCC3306343.1 C4-dicarboxylate TRAP transporter substrate-binding protein [Sneathiella sp. HT1-7]
MKMKILQQASKRAICLFAGIVAATTALVSQPISAVAEPLTIRYAHFGANRGGMGDNINWFKNQIETRSKGDLLLDIHWGGSLGAPADVPRVVGAGLADMGTIVSSYTPGVLDLYEVGNQLVGPSNLWVAQQAIYELATTSEPVKKQFAGNNLTYIGNFNAGAVQLICKEPLTSLNQLKDLKIRTGGPYTDVLKRMGATTIAMPQTEVYQALSTGLVDCNQIYHLAIEGFRQYEVAKHVVELDFGLVMAYGIIMNKDLWDELSDERKSLIRGVADDLNARVVSDHLARVGAAKTKLSGDSDEFRVIYAAPPEGMLDQIKEYGAELADEWIKSVGEKGLPAQEVAKEYRALIDKYQADFDKNGYPWDATKGKD